MIRSGCYILVAIVALVGPRWMGLVGAASASYRAITIDRQDSTTDFTETATSGAGALSPAPPSDPVPDQPEPRLDANVLAGSGASSAASSIPTSSPGGTPGVMSEVPAPALPFITRLRQTQDRVAAISSPSSVFEPPRAA